TSVLHFDGADWSVWPGPPGDGTATSISRSDDGSVYLTMSHHAEPDVADNGVEADVEGGLWRRSPKGTWSEVPLPSPTAASRSLVPERIWARTTTAQWLAASYLQRRDKSD